MSAERNTADNIIKVDFASRSKRHEGEEKPLGRVIDWVDFNITPDNIIHVTFGKALSKESPFSTADEAGRARGINRKGFWE